MPAPLSRSRRQGATRCDTVALKDSPPTLPPRLAIVLHDVHVVRDREHDDERDDHAAEDVVVKPSRS